MNIATAKNIRLDDFISRATGQEGVLKNGCLWYKSPFRNESTASFKLSPDKKAWYDHGVGQGGNIIDLAKHLANVDDVREALAYIAEKMVQHYVVVNSKQTESLLEAPVKEPYYNLLEVTDFLIYTKNQQYTQNAQYLVSRGIQPERILPYVKNVKFNVKNSGIFNVVNNVEYRKVTPTFYGIGMLNLAAGYEVRGDFYRSGYLKSVVGNKSISVFHALSSTPTNTEWQKKPWFIFYSMMDFFTFITRDNTPVGQYNFIIVHGDALATEAANYLSNITPGTLIHYTHNDPNGNGQRAAQKIKDVLSLWQHSDQINKYHPFKDYNEWHMHTLHLKSPNS